MAGTGLGLGLRPAHSALAGERLSGREVGPQQELELGQQAIPGEGELADVLAEDAGVEATSAATERARQWRHQGTDLRDEPPLSGRLEDTELGDAQPHQRKDVLLLLAPGPIQAPPWGTECQLTLRTDASRSLSQKPKSTSTYGLHCW